MYIVIKQQRAKSLTVMTVEADLYLFYIKHNNFVKRYRNSLMYYLIILNLNNNKTLRNEQFQIITLSKCNEIYQNSTK